MLIRCALALFDIRIVTKKTKREAKKTGHDTLDDRWLERTQHNNPCNANGFIFLTPIVFALLIFSVDLATRISKNLAQWVNSTIVCLPRQKTMTIIHIALTQTNHTVVATAWKTHFALVTAFRLIVCMYEPECACLSTHPLLYSYPTNFDPPAVLYEKSRTSATFSNSLRSHEDLHQRG